MRKISAFFAGLLIYTTVATQVVASTMALSPLELLKNTSNQLISALQQNQATLKTKPFVVYKIVYQLLLPHVDLPYMSKRALGPTWTSITPQQQSQFIEQFTNLLIRTYASALAQYTNEKVVFSLPRSNPNSRVQQIDSSIIREQGPVIKVSYRLRFVDAQWKLYDFSVDGISMIQNFQSQFEQKLKEVGINGLTNELKLHNMQNG